MEDEALLALELESVIEECGHQVVGWAISSEEAIDLAERGGIDLAFVDIHLADGPTGVEVARSLIAQGVRHVVFVTANPKRVPDDFAGAAGVLVKPYTLQGMKSALRFLHEAVRTPPPGPPHPTNLTLSPSFRSRWVTA